MPKIIWDIFIMTILIFTFVVIPYRLAFVTDEVYGWIVTFYVLDFLFFIDIILAFLTSYTDSFSKREITSHTKIFVNYLKTWFFIDVMSVLPFDAMVQSDDANSSSLTRLTRLGKVYKIIRLLRLFKLMKIIKQNKKLVHHFSEKMKIS